MKRPAKCWMLVLWLLGLALMLSACGHSAQQASSEVASVPTWQEQYDLGVRYLSEGNYQEAILAFEMAIEIDPKRAEAYAKAAEAYEAMGDTAAAQAIREKGYAKTGDESLQPVDIAGNDLLDDDPFQMESYYIPWDALEAEHQMQLDNLIHLFRAGDTDALTDALEDPALLAVADRRYNDTNVIRTYYNGVKPEFISYNNEGAEVSGSVEIREENGAAIRCARVLEDGLVSTEVCTGETQLWNWEGPYLFLRNSHFLQSDDGAETEQIEQQNGTSKNGLISGELSVQKTLSVPVREYTDENSYTEQYENGKLQIIGPSTEHSMFPVGYDLLDGGYHYRSASSINNDYKATPYMHVPNDNENYLW